MSGVDWSIFEDNQEDTFGWLLRNNTTGAATSSVGVAGSTNESLELLPLDDVEMDHMMASALAPPTITKVYTTGVGNAISAAGGPGVTQKLDIAPSNIRILALNLDKRYISPNLSGDEMSTVPKPVESGGSARPVAGGSCEETENKHYKEVQKKRQNEQDGKRSTVAKSAVSTTWKKQRISVAASNAKIVDSTRSFEGKTASHIAECKQPQNRQNSKPASPTVADSDPDDDFERKQLRRVKNLVSVREFRKRKLKQQEQNEVRLRRLEAENMDLKMRLKIGKEAILSEQREKQQIKEQMREMLQRNANEQEIAQFLNMYKVTYSDYGPKRREKLHFHLSRIRELILPTQVTKLCLYSVEQGVDMLKRDHVIKEDPMSAPESASATMSLWGILADELEVSEDQQRQILERRAAIKKVRDDLNHTLSIVKKLKDVTDEKNTALEAQVAQLQQILTPSQATRFIIWVKENPAFMYMLDKLVDSTLQNNSDSTGK
uniref:BZIP domain-containing protein n=1 Tax=Hyaloperonospora arabidopsidis (strain Emoy2) TaxID=559515 RepID=M4BQ63_HYAAE